MWPSCPFIFRLPVNDRRSYESMGYFRTQKNIEIIDAHHEIRKTMEVLIKDLSDEEWVYWCIDDRYPIDIRDPEYLSDLIEYLDSNELDLNGIKLFHWREEIIKNKHRKILDRDYHLQSPYSIWGFWQHHFCKTKVLKSIFFSPKLPNPYRIRDINETFHLKKLYIPVMEKTLVPDDNNILFREPCFQGKLTANGLDDLKRNQCPVPPYQKVDIRVEFRDRNTDAFKKEKK